MAEYIDREALRKVLENWRDAHADVDDEQGCGLLEDVIWEVDAQPAADVAPVVRCKGCKHSTLPSKLTQRYGVPGTLTCHNRYSPCNRRNVGGDDFCSYGERKDGGDSDAVD